MGWGRECESAEKLVYEAAEKLRAIKPNHELLKYLFVPEGEEISDETEKAIREEMKHRFWNRDEPWENKPKAMVTAVVMGNYYLALERTRYDILDAR